MTRSRHVYLPDNLLQASDVNAGNTTLPQNRIRCGLFVEQIVVFLALC